MHNMLHSKRECEAVLFLNAIVSITLICNKAKIMKYAVITKVRLESTKVSHTQNIVALW